MTRDYYLTKKDSEKRVMFPATETDGGLLMNPQGQPMVIGDEITAAGFKAADVQVPIADLNPDILPLVLRVGDNRGYLVERRETPSERKAREKAEREDQNAFLKSKGYNWEKRSKYFGGEVGEVVDHWYLIDPDGKEVVGKRDAGNYIEDFGDLKGILRNLGFYGQEAIDEHNARVAEQERVATERSEARAKVDAHFDTKPHTPTPDVAERSLKLISIDVSRTRYAITDNGIWKLVYNGMDGDDWNYNNYSMYIATRYDYDVEVAEAIKFLSK